VDEELVVEPRRDAVAAERLEHQRLDALIPQRLVAARELAQVLNARDLEPDDVGGVVRDALGVGIRKTHPDRDREGVTVHPGFSIST
jgi:hypothetical protein